MIALPTGTRVWIAAGVTDLSKGMDGLAALVQVVLSKDPLAGHVFVFRGRRGDQVKLLWWSGDGMNLYIKRLDRGRFIWPQADSGAVHLSAAQLSMLLEGIDWRRPARTWQPEMAVSPGSRDDGARVLAHAARKIAGVPIALNQLPDDIETRKRMLLERDAPLVMARHNERAHLTLIGVLTLQIAKLKRMQFGEAERTDRAPRADPRRPRGGAGLHAARIRGRGEGRTACSGASADDSSFQTEAVTA